MHRNISLAPARGAHSGAARGGRATSGGAPRERERGGRVRHVGARRVDIGSGWRAPCVHNHWKALRSGVVAQRVLALPGTDQVRRERNDNHRR